MPKPVKSSEEREREREREDGKQFYLPMNRVEAGRPSVLLCTGRHRVGWFSDERVPRGSSQLRNNPCEHSRQEHSFVVSTFHLFTVSPLTVKKANERFSQVCVAEMANLVKKRVG